MDHQQDPQEVSPEEQEAEQRMFAAFESALAHNIPSMTAVERETTIKEFFGTLGRLADVLKSVGHPTPAKAAAVLQIAANLRLDKAGAHEQMVVITLTKTWEMLQAEMRVPRIVS